MYAGTGYCRTSISSRSCHTSEKGIPLWDALCFDESTDELFKDKEVVPLMKDYMERGYVPYDISSTSASTTLEYAYDDWTIYRAAKALGQNDLAGEYRKRAFNYVNVFPSGDSFAQAQYRDGSWK